MFSPKKNNHSFCKFAGTTGLYRNDRPVAILDFASLYPSIYRAHNLCYTTLVHPEDVAAMPPDHLTITPTGAAFIKPEVRRGIIPSILEALISARAATRAELAATKSPAQRAVLDSRQKALKVTANALYGFTGEFLSLSFDREINHFKTIFMNDSFRLDFD